MKASQKLPMKLILRAALFLAVLAALFLFRPSASDRILEPEPVTGDAGERWEGYREKLEEREVSASFQAGRDAFAYRTAQALLSQREENADYSPLSLYYALGMTALGAEGETYEELAGLLGVGDREELKEEFRNLYETIFYSRKQFLEEQRGYGEDAKGSGLTLANSIWVEEDVNLDPDYAEDAAEWFYALARQVDFEKDAVWKEMEDWIRENTEGMVDIDLMPRPDTVLALVNALYYRGAWEKEFSEGETRREEFFRADGSGVLGDFMHGSFPSGGCVDGDGFQAASLYMGNGDRMVFVLPGEGRGLEEILASPEALKRALEPGGGGEPSGQLGHPQVFIYVPSRVGGSGTGAGGTGSGAGLWVWGGFWLYD